MDYEDRFYNGDPVECVTFEAKGFVYGPLRVSYPPHSMFYIRFVEPASRTDFVRDKIAIFFIRDPRDILVSSYYSFGYTHGFGPVRQIEAQQRQAQGLIQRKTIDAYALEAADATLNYFRTIDRLAQACNRGIVLKYEDMIYNWEKFSSGLTRYLDLDPIVLHQIYERSRPLEREDLTSHRRAGRPGAYRNKLLPATVEALKVIFAPVLRHFHYEP